VQAQGKWGMGESNQTTATTVQNHHVLLFVATNERNCRQILWSSTKFLTNFMDKIKIDNGGLVFGQPWIEFWTNELSIQCWPMTSGAGWTDGKGGGRENPKMITTVIRVLGYLGLGRGETEERRIAERKEELS
jgi:hypothetical protein